MRPTRLQRVLLAGTTVIVVAFTVAVLLDRPAGHAPAATPSVSPVSSSAGAPDTPAASGFQGAALPADLRARNFTLTDQAGRPVSLSSYRGQVVMIAFVYSTCGPTCIVIAQQIRGALDELPHPVPVLLVSVNPQADTPASVRRFLAQVSLSGRVHYLTGSLSQLRPVWSAYGIDPASVSSASASVRSAQIGSSTGVLLIDARGFERVLFAVEQLTPEALVHDIRRLQSQS